MIRKGLGLKVLEGYTAQINNMFPCKNFKEKHTQYLKIYKIIEEVSEESHIKGTRELANKLREAITQQESLI